MSNQLYAISILWILGVGGASAGLLKFIYKPMTGFATRKRRTVEHSPRESELRLMVCVHHPENVPPLVALFESSHLNHPSFPLSITLLHQIPLVGHSVATLAPYRHKKRCYRSRLTSVSDIIVNAFHSLELTLGRSLSIAPFVGMSPCNTMHEDACTLANDRRVVLMVLPFHVHVSNGTEHRNATIQSVNINVLRYAPCSVAILIDHGILNGPEGALARRVKVFYLGGADDREALAYGARMAVDPMVGLTVVRVVLVQERRSGQESRKDEKAIGMFKELADDERVVYREEVVNDGVGAVAVLKSICEDCTLLIVGRREGEPSMLTAGLQEFSDYPELGAVGDMMATAEFAAALSTLVVQQQVRKAGSGFSDDLDSSDDDDVEEKKRDV